MNKKIKILFISKESRGGMETVLRQFDRLDSSKFNKLYCFYKRDSLAKNKKEYVYIQNNRSGENNFSFKRGVALYKDIFSTFKIIKSYEPDIVFALDIYSVILISILRLVRFYKCKYVSLINTNFPIIVNLKPNFFYKILMNFSLRLSTKCVDKFVFTSKELLRNFIHNYRCPQNKTVYISNSVDHALLSKLKKSSLNRSNLLKFRNKNIKLFYVGRLDNQKDVSTIIKAFKIVKNKIDNINLYIIGDGENKNELIKEAEKLNIINSVYFLGWQRNIYKYLKYANIFIFSSFYEGFAMVIVEAMSLGIPVISTNTPFGPSEIIGRNNKYGYLVPIGDKYRMAKRILELSTSKKNRGKYSKLSLRRSNDFTINKMLSEYETLLISLNK